MVLMTNAKSLPNFAKQWLEILPVQLVYKGMTPCCHPRFSFSSSWHITFQTIDQLTEETMLQYIKHIIMPYMEKMREELGDEKAALVIMDNLKGPVTT